ncbi:AmmeMemoRadiSam system radical SAM enzyme [Candidatus Bipolaricaulota bacterium]|nr:AmmeMemoRadiSam system radical SAM enzyme [Candidatus Bipolaricaulota bacterium]
MKEAMLYERIGDGRVRCNLCMHRCLIANGEYGLCYVRVNRDGRLYSSVYGRVVSRSVEPIEKKPLFHFLPGTCAYSVATVGCNFTCLYCQNHMIAQYPREHGGRILGEEVSPREIVASAMDSGCKTIAYTYTEPTIFFEYAYETARLARAEGLNNVFVTNGYMTPEAIEEILPYLDGANIDLKGISTEGYREVTGGNLRPVLHTIERLSRAKIWVEVTTLIIPGMNDDPQALRWMAEAICGISPVIPWHISRFYPAYRMRHYPPTPIAALQEAERIGREVGLRYIYIGNVPGQGEETYCPACGDPVIRRRGFMAKENSLQDGCCPACGSEVEGFWFAA